MWMLAGPRLISRGGKGAVMESRSKHQNVKPSSKRVTCECCPPEEQDTRRIQRREFLTTSAGAVLGATAIGSVLPVGRALAQVNPTGLAIKAALENQAKSPESLVKVLYETLTP